MVTVSISETYDLHTVVNKMTLIGVHTPKRELIQKTYPGLCMNYKYFRIKSVDVALSTAQQLPLGVDQIGLDTNQIRPQDMMNPILYKAVSNDSWSTLEARLNAIASPFAVTPPIVGSMADVENDNVTGLTDDHGVYYSLLSNRDGFKVAHPQSGLKMSGLRPIVFQQLYNNAVNCNTAEGYNVGGDSSTKMLQEQADSSIAVKSIPSKYFRGRAVPMPRMNTTFLTGDSGSCLTGMGNGLPANANAQMPSVPPVMLGAIVLPPVTATTGILYYRMVTRCWIEFTDVRPITEIASFGNMNAYYSGLVYHSDYASQSAKMDATTDMVDIKNGEIEKIMEGR